MDTNNINNTIIKPKPKQNYNTSDSRASTLVLGLNLVANISLVPIIVYYPSCFTNCFTNLI